MSDDEDDDHANQENYVTKHWPLIRQTFSTSHVNSRRITCFRHRQTNNFLQWLTEFLSNFWQRNPRVEAIQLPIVSVCGLNLNFQPDTKIYTIFNQTVRDPHKWDFGRVLHALQWNLKGNWSPFWTFLPCTLKCWEVDAVWCDVVWCEPKGWFITKFCTAPLREFRVI